MIREGLLYRVFANLRIMVKGRTHRCEIRVSDPDFCKIQKLVDTGEFQSVADFIRISSLSELKRRETVNIIKDQLIDPVIKKSVISLLKTDEKFREELKEEILKILQ